MDKGKDEDEDGRPPWNTIETDSTIGETKEVGTVKGEAVLQADSSKATGLSLGVVASTNNSRSNLLTSLSEPALDRLVESERVKTTTPTYHGSLKVGTDATSTTMAMGPSSSSSSSSSSQQPMRQGGVLVQSSSANTVIGLRGKEKRLRVSYCFKPGDGGKQVHNDRHCFGVNCLALSHNALPILLEEGEEGEQDLEESSGKETAEDRTSRVLKEPCFLFSAGRDSTVRCWDVSSVNATNENSFNVSIPHVRSFEHHTDWVNDLFITK